jgi:hypothetical protein
VTGHEYGHLGGPDVIVGLDRVLGVDPNDEGESDDDVVVMGASAAYGFGMAMFTRTSTPGRASP